jgi:glycosyltransferase involved in cell wall biosynthesis
MTEGFGPARNVTIDAASGDWIMWMDADEEIPMPGNIWRLMRTSGFNAYGTPQVHYSAQPAQVLTTDYPCRLFRNHRGVQFYGLVHEHPEDAPGKSITPVALAPDVQFLHSGYLTEQIRRRRFQRNLPLLMRDVREHPDRILNKFLLIRDIAQSLQFETQAGQPPTEERIGRARQGVGLFNEMIGLDPVSLRMVIDSLQYYSLCNEYLNQGFIAQVKWKTVKPGIDTLTQDGSFDARFENREAYFKLLNLIAKETTKHYESEYV